MAALEHKLVTMECIASGGTMEVWERDAAKLIATKRWRLAEVAEPAPPAAEPEPEAAPEPELAPEDEFGEDLED